VRQFGIADFGDVTKLSFVEMPEQRVPKSLTSFAPGCLGVAVQSKPSFDKWPQQPEPHGSWIVAAVALCNITGRYESKKF